MTEHTLSDNIQKLADGTLTESERRETLLWIEQSAPCYWRDLALAFAEAQIVREAALAGLSEHEFASLPPLKKRTRAAGWKWGAAACACAGMFVAGSIVNSDRDSPPRVVSAAQDKVPGPSDASATVEDRQQPFASKIHPSPDLARSAAAVRKLNAAIADSGYEASLITRFVSRKTDDGGRIVIPVNKMIVRQRAE
ncbi:MAG: hypothetical protein R3F19_30605 [Verrucomicrobiales bacterium]